MQTVSEWAGREMRRTQEEVRVRLTPILDAHGFRDVPCEFVKTEDGWALRVVQEDRDETRN